MVSRCWRVKTFKSSLTGASFLALVVLSRVLNGQTLGGTVRDSLAHRTIPGAVVALLDSSGVTLSRTLTNEQGQFSVALAAAATRVRVIRIGFRPSESPIRHSGGVADHVDILLAPLQTFLNSLTGPVAQIVGVAAIVLCGFAIAFSEGGLSWATNLIGMAK